MPRFYPASGGSLSRLSDVDLDGGDGLADLRTLRYDAVAEAWTPRQTFNGVEERLVAGAWEISAGFFATSRGTKHTPHSGAGRTLYRVNGHTSGGSSTAFHVDGIALDTGSAYTAVSGGGGNNGDNMACVVNGYPYAVAKGTPYHLWRFDPEAGTWADVGAKLVNYGSEKVAVCGLLGEVIIFGRDYVTAYNPATGSMTALTNPTSNDSTWTEQMLIDAAGFLYAFGGSDGGVATDTVLRYDRLSDAWTEVSPMPEPRRFASAVYHNGIVYVFGGLDAAGAATDTVFAYFPQSDAWIDTGYTLPTTTGHSTFGGGGAAMSDGSRIVIAGAAAGAGADLWVLS